VQRRECPPATSRWALGTWEHYRASQPLSARFGRCKEPQAFLLIISARGRLPRPTEGARIVIGALVLMAIAMLAIMAARVLERRERARNPALYLPRPDSREYSDTHTADAPRG
jgi:hypothetical protein